jgi:WD40 repeat protein
LRPKVPRDLATICLKCLEKEPARRYATVPALAADLRRFLAGEPVSARPVSRIERSLRWCRKRPALTAALAALVLVTVVGLSLVFWQWRATEAALENGNVASYFHRVNLAHHEWLSGNTGRADQLLGECPPDLRHWEWHYVRHLCDDDLLSLEEHAAPVNGVAYSRCGKYLATVSGKWDSAESGEVQVSSAATGERLWQSRSHRGPVECVAFSSDGRLLASGSANWRTLAGEVVIWEAQTGAERCRLPDVGKSVFAIAFSPDDRLLAVGQTDGAVRLWDVEGGRWSGSLTGPFRHTVFRIAFTPDGRRAVVAGINGAVVWDMPSRRVCRKLRGKKPHEQVIDVRCADVSPDGKLLVTASFDKSVKVWDLATGRETDAFFDHQSPVISAAFSPDGRCVVTGDYAGTIRIRSLGDRRADCIIRGHNNSITGMAFSPDGTRLLTGSVDHRARVWDLTAAQGVRELNGDAISATSIAFSPGGERLVASGWRSSWGNEGRIRIWDGLTAAGPRVLPGHGGACVAIACSPDRKAMASGGDDRSIKIWNLESGALLSEIPAAHKGPVNRVTYSEDGTRLASAGGDGAVALWDLSRNRSRGPVLRHPHLFVNGAAFSGDGAVVVTWGERGMLFLWDSASGARIASLAGHEGTVHVVVMSPDGRTMASAGEDRVIRIWDFSRPRQPILRRALVGHTDYVQCLAFSRDGKRLASGSRDKTVKFWDVSSGHEALSLRGNANWVNAVAFGPDDRTLVFAVERLRALDAGPCTDETKIARRRQVDTTAAAWHWREAGKCLASDPPHWFGLAFHARQMSGRLLQP